MIFFALSFLWPSACSLSQAPPPQMLILSLVVLQPVSSGWSQTDERPWIKRISWMTVDSRAYFIVVRGVSNQHRISSFKLPTTPISSNCFFCFLLFFLSFDIGLSPYQISITWLAWPKEFAITILLWYQEVLEERKAGRQRESLILQLFKNAYKLFTVVTAFYFTESKKFTFLSFLTLVCHLYLRDFVWQ